MWKSAVLGPVAVLAAIGAGTAGLEAAQGAVPSTNAANVVSVVERRIEFSHAAMGTEFRLVVYAADAMRAAAAARAAFDRVDEIERALSDYRVDSELSGLAQAAGTGRSVPVTTDVWRVLVESQIVARGTDGAFDVTVGPLTRLQRWSARRGRLPDAGRVAEALAAVGHDALRLDPALRAVTLLHPGMRLDAGGIAKGYAVDRAFDVIVSFGFPRALVDGGGDLRVGDPPPGADGWEIAVPTEGSAEAPVWQTMEISNSAIATSGPSARSLVVDGVRYSHVIDPRDGRPVMVDRWVTVFADRTSRADALASALSVLGEAGRSAAGDLGASLVSVVEIGGAVRSHGSRER